MYRQIAQRIRTLLRSWGGQARRRRTYLRELYQRIQLTLVLWKVSSVGVRTAHSGRAFVNRRETCSTDFKLGELVVRDFDGVARVSVAGCNSLSRLVKSV